MKALTPFICIISIILSLVISAQIVIAFIAGITNANQVDTPVNSLAIFAVIIMFTSGVVGFIANRSNVAYIIVGVLHFTGGILNFVISLEISSFITWSIFCFAFAGVYFSIGMRKPS